MCGHMVTRFKEDVVYKELDLGVHGIAKVGDDGTVHIKCPKCNNYKRDYGTHRGPKSGKRYLHSKMGLIHRIVLEAFKGPCPEGMEACHNDGIPHHNRPENLRWDTHYNNMQDAKKHGVLRKKKPAGYMKTRRTKSLQLVLELSEKGMSTRVIARKVKEELKERITSGTIARWIRNKEQQGPIAIPVAFYS